MKKTKRKVLLAVILILIVVWAVRFYQLNNGFHVNREFEQVEYGRNEWVSFDDYYIGMQSCKGYEVNVLDVKMWDIDEYLKTINMSKDDFQALPKRVLEVSMNIANRDSDAPGVSFVPIQLFGLDWYETVNTELIAWANEEVFEGNVQYARGICVDPGNEYTVKLIYRLNENTFTKKQWENLNKEPMWLELTNWPVRKMIRIQ